MLEQKKNIAQKNFVLLLVLLLIIALLFGITIMRIGQLPPAANPVSTHE